MANMENLIDSPPVAMSREKLSPSTEIAELKAEVRDVRDEVTENRTRMEEMFMASIVASFEGNGEPDDAPVQGAETIEVNTMTLMILLL